MLTFAEAPVPHLREDGSQGASHGGRRCPHLAEGFPGAPPSPLTRHTRDSRHTRTAIVIWICSFLHAKPCEGAIGKLYADCVPSAVQDNKADVIDKYMPDEVRALKTAGELPDSVKLNETEEGGEDNFEFGSGGEDEDEISEEEEEKEEDDIDDI